MAVPFDVTASFLTHFKREIEERGNGVDVKDYRSAGRPTKAKPNGEDALFWTEEGPRQVTAYIQWRDTMAWQVWTLPDGSPAIELDLTSFFRDVPVRTIIDRIFETPEGDLVVVDLKSGSSKPDSILQLEFYAGAIENIFGTRPKWGSYWHGRTGGLLEMHALPLTVDDIGDMLQAFRRAKAQDVYIPHLSRNCARCAVAHACKYVGGPDAHLYQNHGKGTGDDPSSPTPAK